MPVYFIRAGEDGPIKIGFTTGSINRRIAMLQTGNPQRLELVGIVDGGDIEDERLLHMRFNETRLVGEWFAPSDALLSHIAQHPPGNRKIRFSAGLAPAGIQVLEHERIRLGLTVTEFCSEIRTNRGTWQRWKAGKSMPHHGKLSGIQMYLSRLGVTEAA